MGSEIEYNSASNRGQILPNVVDVSAPDAQPPEVELILACAGLGTASERAERIRSLAGAGPDWSCVLKNAAWHGMMPLLNQELEAACPDRVPEAVRDELKNQYCRTLAHNLLLKGELVTLVKLFEAEEIPAIPFKGPLLADAFYRNLALRQFWDLDILVHRHDALRAKELLVARGYHPAKDLSHEKEQDLLESDCEYPLVGIDGKVIVEIHWQILPPHQAFGYKSDYLWDRAVPAPLEDVTTLTLRPEDLLLILCIHAGEKHHWSLLKWICDVARLISVHDSMEWDRIFMESSQLGRERTVSLALFLANMLLGAPLPASIAERVRNDPRNAASAGHIRGRLFCEDIGLPGFLEWLRTVKSMERTVSGKASELSRWSYLLRYLKVILTPEWTDRQGLPLPTPLSLLHYLSRPTRLLAKHHIGLIRRLFD